MNTILTMMSTTNVFLIIIILISTQVFIILICTEGIHSKPKINGTALIERHSNIAYGNILNRNSKVDHNNSCIIRIAKFAVDFAKQRQSHTIILDKNGNILPYKVSHASKLEMFYTEDQENMFMTDMYNASENLGPLSWGHTYTFTISQTTNNTLYKHYFIVIEYQDKTPYIFKHAFTKDVILPTTKERTIGKSANKRGNAAPQIISHDLHSMSTSKKAHGKHKILKILTFNIWNVNIVKGSNMSYIDRIRYIAKLCEESGADIIGFQEVRFQDGKGGDWGPNQVEHLSRLLTQFQFVYQPAQIQLDHFPDMTVEGVAFFSRYSIRDHHYTLLSHNESDALARHQRVLLRANIHVTGFGQVNVYNTHLSLSRAGRIAGVKQIWRIIRQQGYVPTFLVGDFNAGTNSDEIKFLQGKRPLNGYTTKDFHDVWLRKHGSTRKGYTFSTLNKKLSKRIDFVFMKLHRKVSVADIQLLGDSKRGAEAASDHVGLLATFHLRS